ncbi:MAG: hypothetical protein AB1556_00460 [Bacillota bacterium]
MSKIMEKNVVVCKFNGKTRFVAYSILALKPAGAAAPYVIGDLAEALSDSGHTVHLPELQELAGQSPEAVKNLVISRVDSK